ncbi:MAG: hypothetical protein E5Y60_30695, partial [Mesorhizobium sp.]
MASSLTTFTDEAKIALDTLSGRATGLFSPSLRLGVTGLSRAGKTVFISAFVHNLIHGGRLPLFEAFDMAVLPVRADLSQEWRALSAAIDANADADEMTARRLAESFAAYLKACKLDERALSTLPPGRFLMPGDLEGSPALTFAPLPGLSERRARPGSLQAMMERRY